MAAADHPSRHQSAAAQAQHLIRTFRRISWQRIDIDAEGNGRGLVTGLRHRLPCTVQVPLDTAIELRRLGVRTVVHHDRDVA